MYNNIKYHYSNHEPLIPNYMSEKIITLKKGRQLFVDNYLIDNLINCNIKYYQAVKHENNPILKPRPPYKRSVPNMDSVIWDPYSRHFKMWYTDELINFPDKLTFLISDNGVDWYKPIIINKKTTSILPCCSKCKNLFSNYEGNNNNLCLLGGCQNGKKRGSSTQILDRKEKNRDKIYKMVFGHCHHLNICTSKDGINWELSKEKSIWGGGSPWYLCYNPFKKTYVYTLRDNVKPGPPFTRVNRFKEVHNINDTCDQWNVQRDFGGAGFTDIKPNDPQIVVVADKYDKTISNRIPGIYCCNIEAYESLILFFISVYQGQSSSRNLCIECYNGYSRDGIQYTRPINDRKPFIPESKEPLNQKKESYCIATGGNVLVFEDKIYIYTLNYNQILKEDSTYLYTLRRDGFASITSIHNRESTVLTKTLIINGDYLFVNFDNNENGYLYIELLDENNNIVENYSKKDCNIIKTNSTKIRVNWGNIEKINSEENKKIKIKFYFIGSIYSFWFSDNETGESNGFIGNGGPDYDYYSDSKKTEKLNITKFSNVECTIKHNKSIKKIIYCLPDYAIKINDFERKADECGIILNYKNSDNDDKTLNINSPYKIEIINVKLIL